MEFWFHSSSLWNQKISNSDSVARFAAATILRLGISRLYHNFTFIIDLSLIKLITEELWLIDRLLFKKLWYHRFPEWLLLVFVSENLILYAFKIVSSVNTDIFFLRDRREVKWYFVTKIVLTDATVRKNCSSRTIYSNSERSEQFLVTECFFNLFLEVYHP